MGHYSDGAYPISVYRSKITEQIERQIINEQNRRAGLPELPDPRDRRRRAPRANLIETVWASPDGVERIAVTYRSNRESAIERVARTITKQRYCLASAPHATYLRWQGWRLVPDDGEPGDGRIWCVECRRLHPRDDTDCPVR